MTWARARWGLSHQGDSDCAAQILDYDQFYLNLTDVIAGGRPEWRRAYTMLEHFGLDAAPALSCRMREPAVLVVIVARRPEDVLRQVAHLGVVLGDTEPGVRQLGRPAAGDADLAEHVQSVCALDDAVETCESGLAQVWTVVTPVALNFGTTALADGSSLVCSVIPISKCF